MLDKEYIKSAVSTESMDWDKIRARSLSIRSIRLLHAAMGLCTEAGELLDTVKKYLFYGKEIDVVNLLEEAGDIFWYLAILFDEFDFDPQEVMQRNIEKLRARYGEKFGETQAQDRDLEKEREILEGNDDGGFE